MAAPCRVVLKFCSTVADFRVTLRQAHGQRRLVRPDSCVCAPGVVSVVLFLHPQLRIPSALLASSSSRWRAVEQNVCTPMSVYDVPLVCDKLRCTLTKEWRGTDVGLLGRLLCVQF